MISEIYSVFDEKADAYLPTFTFPSRGMAVRAFTDLVNDKTHNFGAHPEDYTLICFGTWDDSDGSFDLLQIPITLGKGLHFLSHDVEEPDLVGAPLVLAKEG